MKKYFVFKDTISGWSYFWRMWIQIILIAAFGLGLYLLAVTSYKRASPMTERKWLRFLAIPTLPIIGTLNILMANESDADYLMNNLGPILIIVILCYLGIHVWLLFFDSMKVEHMG